MANPSEGAETANVEEVSITSNLLMGRFVALDGAINLVVWSRSLHFVSVGYRGG